MIIADTSVWIDYFNGTDSAETDALDHALENNTIALGDLIFLEILQGFRSDKDYETAKEYLTALDQYNMLTTELAITAAENFRYLRKKGITIRKTADIIIATFCIEYKIPLLFTDRDFIPFTEHLGLLSVTNKV